MLSKILIVSDASEAACRMIECVGHLKRVGTQEAILVHVFNVEDVGGLSGTLRAFYLPKLKEQCRVLAKQGLNASFELPLGIPEFEINELAKKQAVKLIVIGAPGHSRISDLFLGSTAFRILHSSLVPVLLIHREQIEDAGTESCNATCDDFFRHVLHPTDFSDNSGRAYQYLEYVVQETRCAVTVLHVQEPATHVDEKENTLHAERLERRRERLTKLGATSVEILVEPGNPALKIVERANECERSLILMGSQGKGFMKELFFGSVAHTVASQTSLPVLFVPAARN